MTVSRVVSGLSDDALKVKAIERGVASSSNLEESFRIIRDQRENLKSKWFNRILKALNQVTEVLQDFAYRYNNPNELHQIIMLACQSTPQQSYITPILNQNALPSAARQLTSRFFSMPNSQGMNEYPREVKFLNIDDNNPWKQQADYTPQVQKTEVRYQGPEYRGENPWKGESSWAMRWHNRDEQTVPSQNADRNGKGREDMITPQSFHSSHLMVNGEIEYRNNKHRQKKEVFERRETQPKSFIQSSDQLTANEVEIEQRKKHRYEAAGLPQPYIEERTMPRNNGVEEMSVEELIALDKITGQNENKVNAVDESLDEYLLDEPLEVETSKTSFPRNTTTTEKTKERSPTESEILLSAHVIDRDNTKRPRTHHDILNDEDIEPLPKVSSIQDEFTQFRGRAKLGRRQIEPLINARINEGPLDYMKILGRTKVEVSLTDLAQMSPAARKHWKHGILRVNDKRSRRKRHQAEISEVASNSLSHPNPP
ncbi:hypothetical protein EV44_g1958 [Erysiphe necator]|uniref:Uncharacterized protein n=1 Tax=Uncinula necator TaxID=52586 RepID=A0A0B1P7B1_UNCNE|nr:hypothetical protein EV44_g1958 [Erysiphe necator]